MITEPAAREDAGSPGPVRDRRPARCGLRSHVRIWWELFIDVNLCLF